MTNNKMQAENSQAISFANGYFSLVDGLAYGFEDHLTEDVRLEWFGRVIRGRKNVAAFMRTHMTNCRHIFGEIAPAVNIDSRRCRLPRRKYKSEGSLADNVGNITEGLVQSELSFAGLQIKDEDSNIKEEMNLELNSDDLNSVSPKTETTQESEDVKKFEKMIEDVQDIKNEILDDSQMKFIQAKGIIQLDRRANPNKIRKFGPAVFASSKNGHKWRRRCILKIAYSSSFKTPTRPEADRTKSTICASINEAIPMSCELNIKREIPDAPQGRKRLKSSDDILESITGLEANFDPFEDFDYFDEKQRFLECFEAEIAAGELKLDLTTPKYVGDRLVFDWTGRINAEESGNLPKGFNFNYSIHTIVYECNMECKLNLCQEFEKQENLS